MAINIPIFSSLDSKGFDRLKKEFRSLETTSQKAAFVLRKAMLPAAAAIGGVAAALGKASQAAADDQKSQARFEQTIKTTVGALNSQTEALDQYVTTTQMATGVSDSLVRDGLGNLLRATRDVTQAQRLMNLSLDISAATGRDLESVTLAMGRAAQGQFTALRRLGVPLSENTVKTKDFEAATRQLSSVFGGAAQANANTFSGRLARLRERVGELWESIGYRVLPILETLLGVLDRLIAAAGQNGLSGAFRVLRGELIKMGNNTDGSVSAWGHFINALVHVRNWIAKAYNALARLVDLLPWVSADTLEMAETFEFDTEAMLKMTSQTLLAAEAQKKLNGFMGPVASRNVDELAGFYESYRDSLRSGIDTMDDMDEKLGGTTKKIKDKTKAARENAKAVREEMARAYDDAANLLRDQFSPALMQANERLTAATDTYNDFYSSVRQSVMAVGDLGAAWQEAADSEGAKTFFGVLQSQADRAKNLASNIKTLINRGLDDPALLQTILSTGGETGSKIIDALVAGGDDAIKQLREWSTAIGSAADEVAKLAADKWYKSGVDQAQAIVNGINSVIEQTEFALRFTVDAAGVARVSESFSQAIANINAGLPGSVYSSAGSIFGPNAGMVGNYLMQQDLGGFIGTRTGAVTTNNVNINVSGGDPNAVVSALRTYMRRNGSVPIQTSSLY